MSDFMENVLKTVDDSLPQLDPRLITIGCVMTNQARKDWGLAAAICSGLRDRLPNIHFWWHVDTRLRHWSIDALIADFNLDGCVLVTQPPMDDHTMAAHYRACDLTILPSLGEGWGYPIVESFACGVPCVHGNYGGGASLLHSCNLAYYLVDFDAARLDTQYNCVRPVFHQEDWIAKVMMALDSPRGTKPLSENVEHLQWMKLAHPWRKWLRDGLGAPNGE